MERSPSAAPMRVRNDAEFEAFVAEFTSYEARPTFRYNRQNLNLERMSRFAAELGSPHLATPAVHVAGTKGKGTTCLLLEALLEASGLSTGVFLSPHIEHLRERIRLRGEPITEQELCATLDGAQAVLERLRALGPRHFPTFFELMTALAMQACRRRGVDVAIYEVGLGGRLDATNILQPEWTAITSIGLEHTRALGKTLEKIAAEKAGIVKPATPLVLGNLPEEARKTAREIAAKRGAPVLEVDFASVERLGSADGERLRVRLPARREAGATGEGADLQLVAPAGAGEGIEAVLAAGAVRGPALRDDLAIALELWRGVLARRGLSPRVEALAAALESVRLAARVELFNPVPPTPPVILDGAHTRESMAALTATVEELGWPRPRRALFSLARDKQIDAVLAELAKLADHVVFTRADRSRSAPPERLARAFRRTRSAMAGAEVGSIEVVEDPRAALELCLERNEPVIVTGSIYLAGVVRPILRAE